MIPVYDDTCLRYIDYLRCAVERVERGEKDEMPDETDSSTEYRT